MPYKRTSNTNRLSYHQLNSVGKIPLLLTLILLLIAIGVSATEFYIQLKYADAIGYTSWPFNWDNNRYVDTARLYLNAIQDGGWHGLVRMYADKPPYSITLLLTGLPFLSLTGQDHSLFASQAIYLLLMDAGLVFSIWRLTGSMRWAAFGLLTFTSWTSGIVSSVDLNNAMESVRYQLNVPLPALYIALSWMTLEALHTSRTNAWGIGLTLLLTLGLLLRPPMLPFFVLAFFPLLAIIFALAVHQGRRPLAAWTVFALIFSSTTAGLHYINIWPRLLTYVNSAVSEQGHAMFGTQKTGWDYIWFYLDAATHNSPAISILLAAIVLTIPHFISVIKGLAGSLKDRVRAQEAAKPIMVWWLLLVAYAVPTLASTKNFFFGTPFMLMAWIGGTHALFVLWHAQLASAQTHDTALHSRVATTLGVVILAASLFISARDIKWTWDFSHSVDEIHLRRLHAHNLSREIHQAIARSIYNWATLKNLRDVSIDIDDRRRGAYAYPDIHNLSIGVKDISQGRLRLYPSQMPMLGVEIECDPRQPLTKEALGMPIDRYWPERTEGKFHDGSFVEIQRLMLSQACTIVLYESTYIRSALSYGWP